MSNFYGELLIRITSDTAGLSKGLQSSAAQTGAVSKAMESAGKRARVSWERVGLGMQNVGRTMSQFVTIPIAAGFAVAGIAAFKFQDNLMKIQNLTGTSAAQTKLWGDELLKLGAITGQTPIALAESLYFVASSGFKGAEAMQVINVSAKAAAAGLGDVKVTADVLTSAMNSYGHGTYTAAQVTDYLMKTIEVGKAEPIALATSLGRIMPVANQLKIGLDELGGNVAALTLGGLSSAEAVTALRGTMVALVAPAKMSIDQLKTMGLSYKEVTESIANKGLLPTLKMLWEETDHNMLSMRKLIPNTRALNGVLSLLGANYGENLKVIEKVSHAQGSLDRAMENTAQQPVQKLRIAWASLQAEFIKAGALILPVVADVAQVIVKLAQAVNNMSPEWRASAMWAGAFLAALGPIVMISGSVIRSVALIRGAFMTLWGGGALAALLPVGAFAAAIATAVTLAVDAGMEKAAENAKRRATTGDAYGWKDFWSEMGAAATSGGKWFSRVSGNDEINAFNSVMWAAGDALDVFAKKGGMAALQARYLRGDLDALSQNRDILGDLNVEKTVGQMVKWRKSIMDNLHVGKREAEAVLRTMFGDGVAFSQAQLEKLNGSVKGLTDRITRLKSEQARATVFGDFLGAERAGKQIDALEAKLARVQTLSLRKQFARQSNTVGLPLPDWTKGGTGRLRIPVPQWQGEMKFPKINVGGAKVALQGIGKYLDLIVRSRKITITAKVQAVKDVLKGVNERLKEIGDHPKTAKLKAEKRGLEATAKAANTILDAYKKRKNETKLTADNTQARTAVQQVKDDIATLMAMDSNKIITVTEERIPRRRARGGIDVVSSPTPFLAGEGRSPEIAAFFPLNDPNRSAALLGRLNEMMGQGKSLSASPSAVEGGAPAASQINVVLPGGTCLVGTARDVAKVLAPHVGAASSRVGTRQQRGRV